MGTMSFVMACYINNNFGSVCVKFGVQRNDAPKATIPHTENKPWASNANPSAALFFFEEVEVEVEDAADPLAVPLPEDVPLPVPCGVVEEGVAVGAGDAKLENVRLDVKNKSPS